MAELPSNLDALERIHAELLAAFAELTMLLRQSPLPKDDIERLQLAVRELRAELRAVSGEE
jgi:hypothetical protein